MQYEPAIPPDPRYSLVKQVPQHSWRPRYIRVFGHTNEPRKQLLLENRDPVHSELLKNVKIPALTDWG